MIKSKYFSESEFQRCNPACSLQDMNQSTINRFDTARHIAGIPFVINSAYRSVAHEKSRNRAGTSSHTLGRALDIRCNSNRNRFLIVTALIKAGFTRIGIYSTFIHADDSPSHNPSIIWLS